MNLTSTNDIMLLCNKLKSNAVMVYLPMQVEQFIWQATPFRGTVNQINFLPLQPLHQISPRHLVHIFVLPAVAAGRRSPQRRVTPRW